MKITYMSDLHLEFGWLREEPEEGDILILAGDIDFYPRYQDKGIRHWMYDQLKRFNHVLFVTGNHEYYNGDFNCVNDMFFDHEAQLENFHFLYNSSVIIEGIKFIGCTWWTDFKNNDPMIKHQIQFQLNDYQLIWKGHNKLLPDDIYQEHERSSQFLVDEIEKSGLNSVVITHHAPSEFSSATHYRGTVLNYGFCNSWEKYLEMTGPKYWIHGHCHTTSAYKIGETTVLCNPRGYWSKEENPEFDVNKYITM